MIRTAWICGIAVMAGACGKGGESTGDKPAATPAASLDTAAVNALVPASLKDKIVFEKTDIVEERGRRKTIYTVAAPRGWKQDMKSFASLKPEDRALGFMTKFDVGTNCDGECVPKDWPKVIDKVFASYLSGKVHKDVKGPTSRTIIAESATGTTIVQVLSWTDGASRYNQCGATLEEPVKELAAAVEKACQSVAVSGDVE